MTGIDRKVVEAHETKAAIEAPRKAVPAANQQIQGGSQQDKPPADAR